MSAEPARVSPLPDLSKLCVAITEHAPLPMATMEGATRIVRYGNPAFCRLMDQTLEQLVGRPFDELLPEKDQCVTLIQRVFRTGKCESYTEQDPSEPHPVFWSYTIWPVMEHEGLVGVMIQVTETAEFHGATVAMNEALMLGSIHQHELTEAAEQLNAQLRAEVSAREQIAIELSEKARLIDLSNDAIIVRDLNSQIRLWNKGAEKLFGWTFEEVKGKDLHSLLHTVFPKPIEDIIAQLHREGRFNGEVVQQARDGRWVRSLCGWVLDQATESIFTSYTDITERTKAVEALARSEDSYRTLFTSIDEGFCVVEMIFDGHEQPVDYRFLEVNPAFGKQAGLLEPIGKRIRELIPNHEAHWFEIFGKVALTGEPIRFVKEAIWLGRWFDVYACRIGGAESRNVALVFNDITERKNTEEELAEKARLLDLSHDAIIVRDMEGCIRYWNHGAQELYGWSREDALGQVSHVLLQTEFPTPLEDLTRELHGTGRWTGELVHTKRDGQRITVLARKTMDRDSEGNPAAVVENITDITARKQAEEAVRASDERFRALFDLGPVAIFSCDRAGILQNYNRRAAELWGREPKCGEGGEINCGSFRLYHVDGRPMPHEESPIGRTLKEGIVIKDAEVFIERPDGSRIAAAVTFSPLKDENEEVTGAITAFYDITERKEMSDSLADRIADLARADRSKDEFLAMLAHELRNPLAPLRNAAEILRAEASDEEREQAQRILGRQIENMSRMIDDLLDVSRITEGKIELRRAPVALEAILTAVTSLARPGCAAHRQDLSVSMPAEPVFLNADATRLEQVFSNLLGNASKYSGEGCEISLRAERAPGVEPPEVIISVRDDGMGIAPEMLPLVFDLFVQASRTLDRAYGGLGIGLTLVQRLVKLHGGSVEARSEGLGRGSEFIVRLPILSTAPPPQQPPASAAREFARRILIVDDNTDSARSLAVLQRLRGHDTRTAFTGPAAVTAAAEFLPEVVLLDIGLPGMDGFEVARHLRAMPELSGVFLIGMSGYGRDEDRAQAKAAGFDEYMVKPVDLALLREWMRPRATATNGGTAESPAGGH